MTMAYLAFYKGEGDFLNKVVRLFTRSKYSHCAIVAHSIEYSSTSRMGGVYAQRMVIPYDVKEWDIVPVYIPAQDVVAFYNRTKHCKYDYLGALGLVFTVFKQKKSRYFCSEWCAECLRLDKPHKYTPDSLYKRLNKQKNWYRCYRLKHNAFLTIQKDLITRSIFFRWLSL